MPARITQRLGRTMRLQFHPTTYAAFRYEWLCGALQLAVDLLAYAALAPHGRPTQRTVVAYFHCGLCSAEWC